MPAVWPQAQRGLGNDAVSRFARATALVPLLGQSGVSLAHLLIGLLLIREGSPNEYGLFVLGFSIALFLVGMQDGLVSIPAMVRAGALASDARRRFLLWNRRCLYSFALVVAVGGVVISEMMRMAGSLAVSAAFVLAVAGVAGLWVAWDFQRTEALAQSASREMLRVDASYLLALSAFVVLGAAIAVPNAQVMLLSIAGAAWLATLVGVGRGRALEYRWRRLARAAMLWWRRGRFSLFASFVGWVQSQGYIYVCSALLGLETLARVAAARLLFAPLATGLAAWVKASTTRSAEQYRRGEVAALRRQLTRVTTGFAALTLLWCGLAFWLQEFIMEVLFNGSYRALSELVLAWGVASVAISTRTVWQVGLRVSENFLWLSRIASLGAAISVAIVLALIVWFGEIGAVIGLALGEAVIAGFACVMFHRRVIAARANHP